MCMEKETARKIFAVLSTRYSDAWARKRYDLTPYQALITTILSAQTTDRSVDAVRGELFSRYPAPKDLAGARQEDVEEIIKSTGFFRMKAKNIIAAASALVEKFSGEVPDTMEDLLILPGVGRKTANIVLYHAFGRNEGVAVDTHVFRLAGRIGLSDQKSAGGIEKDLMELFPRNDWGVLTDILIAHGRALCAAKNPRCAECPVNPWCRYYHETFLPGKG
jgi:endonuclease-3